MSDSAREAFVESNGSMHASLRSSQKSHRQAVREWGSEKDYSQAHSLFGTEMKDVVPRTLISTTSDLNTARYFANTGIIYEIRSPRRKIIKQTLEGSGESEFLIRHMAKAKIKEK